MPVLHPSCEDQASMSCPTSRRNSIIVKDSMNHSTNIDSKRVMQLMEADLLGDKHQYCIEQLDEIRQSYVDGNQRLTTEIEYDTHIDDHGIQTAHVSILTRRKNLVQPTEHHNDYYHHDACHAMHSQDPDSDIEEIVEEHEGTVTSDHGLIERFWCHSIQVTHFHDLPDWLKDNEHLLTGHRLPLPDFMGCIRSVFSLHTETFNIWTHLIGCLTFLFITLWFLSRPETEVQWQEKIVFSLFFLSAIICLGISAAYHTMSAHSRYVSTLFARLDYVGISILIIGSFIPWMYYGFYCRTEPKIVYIAMIILLGAGCMMVSLSDTFNEPRLKPMRAGIFVATGCSGLVPLCHFMMFDGYKPLWEEAGFHWILLMGVLYILGATCYAARVPERFFPGKFDIWFHSHQIFHLFVIAAALVHYVGICEIAEHRLTHDTCSTGVSH